jgi:hypothetical protein
VTRTRSVRQGPRGADQQPLAWAPAIQARDRDDRPALASEGIDDRAVDLWSALLPIAFVAHSEDIGNRSQDILDVAKDLAAVRDADANADTAARLLERCR